MEISNIKINKVDGRNRLLAYGSITFDNCFVIHNIALYDSDKGRRIVMPRRRTSRGEYKDIAHPTVNDFREFLTTAVSEAYDNSI